MTIEESVTNEKTSKPSTVILSRAKNLGSR